MAAVDPDFRQIAVSNPKQALETFYGQPLDIDIPISFADNSGSTKTFVLPPLMSTSGRGPDQGWPVALALVGLAIWASRRRARSTLKALKEIGS